MLAATFLHFRVNPAVRSQQFPIAQLVGLPVELRHRSSCFSHQQNARGRVPGMQAEFPEAFKPAAGHRSQVQRGRTVPPHAVGPQT